MQVNSKQIGHCWVGKEGHKTGGKTAKDNETLNCMPHNIHIIWGKEPVSKRKYKGDLSIVEPDVL